MMLNRQSRLYAAALAGVFAAALATACFYILLVVVSFFVAIPGVGSAIVIAGVLLSIFSVTFVVAFRKFVSLSSA